MTTSAPVELLVGLGNPGAGHADDRHNVGFWFLDEVASTLGASFREESRYQGLMARAASGLRLLKPTTYMNLSGESVAACANYFRIPSQAILVVHDELDLDAGVVRLKRGGGHGGHNGLRSIHTHLGNGDYLRARIGIGHPGNARDVSDHVLSKPRAEDRAAIMEAMALLMKNLDKMIDGRFDRAMNSVNRRDGAGKDT